MAKFQLTKKQQSYIDEGVKCSQELKKAEKRLDEIKEVLSPLPPGTHVTASGGVLIIASKDYYTPPEAGVLLAELKKSKREKLFPKCVNVVKKACDAILGDDTFDRLRKFSKSGKSFSFK